MEIKTSGEISRENLNVVDVHKYIISSSFNNKKWVSVDSLLEWINYERDNGNIGKHLFSPSFCLKMLIDKLEESREE